MREIKFRFWNPRWKKFVDGDYAFGPNGFGAKGMVEPSQWTGLKDKNGVGIYEGDMVATDNKATVYEVKFGSYKSVLARTEGKAHQGFYVQVVGEKFVYPLVDQSKHIEVIGNIYSNPELLK